MFFYHCTILLCTELLRRFGIVMSTACSRGVSGPGGLPCPWGCLVETPPLGRLLLRVVRILLECILVYVTRLRLTFLLEYLIEVPFPWAPVLTYHLTAISVCKKYFNICSSWRKRTFRTLLCVW